MENAGFRALPIVEDAKRDAASSEILRRVERLSALQVDVAGGAKCLGDGQHPRRTAEVGIERKAAGANDLDGQVKCRAGAFQEPDRKSDEWGKSVSVRVDLGGRRLI